MSTCAVCGVAVSGSDVMYTADGRIVCPACFAKLGAVPILTSSAWRGLAIAGGVVGAVPFAIHMSSSSMSTVNGEVTGFVYRDWVAVLCGVVAAGLGIATLIAGRNDSLRRGLAIAAGIGILALGGLQIARGFGVFETPTHADSSTSITIRPSVPETLPRPAMDPNQPETCGNDDECFDLGRSLEKAKFFDKAIVAYIRACDKKAKGGCFNAGFLLEHREAPDYEKSVVQFDRGCELGHSESCNEAAVAYKGGRGVKKDVDRARKMFEQLCEKEVALGCSNLADFYANGLGIDKDPKRAFDMFVKGCDPKDADSAYACDRAGELLYAGTGVKKDLKAAASYVEKACELSATHCYNFAVLNEHGDGIKKDLAKSRELYDKACSADSPGACFNLGVVYAYGQGVKKDPAKARVLYEKACAADHSDGCNNLGSMLDAGIGGPKDKPRSKELFQKACNAGNDLGCKNLK